MAHHNDDTEKVALLSEMGLFADFTEEELKRVAKVTQMVQFSAGQVIVDQGDPGVDCYLIAGGRASVYVRGEYVTTSTAGSMIGEMALIDHRPRTATVIADTDLDTLKFDSEAFKILLTETPKAAEHIYATLRERLDRLSEL